MRLLTYNYEMVGGDRKESLRVIADSIKSESSIYDPSVFGRDGTNLYYDFLYLVTKDLQPSLVVELGTCTGGRTSHFCAATSGKVISIDIETRPDARERLRVFNNLVLLTGDTRDPELAKQIGQYGPIDLLFIDTDHTAEQVKVEIELYCPLVRQGSLILLDDIRMHPCMSQWWDELDEDKLELNNLHWTSFGVIFR